MSERFEALAREVFEATLARDPAWATQVGWRGLDHALAPADRAEIDRERADVARWLAALEDLGEDSVDAAALEHVLLLARFRLDRQERWRRDPDFAMRLMDHVFPLLIRTRRPLATRVEAMAARLEQAPAWLVAMRARVDAVDVPPVWLESAAETVESAPAFLEAVLSAGRGAPAGTRLARAVEGVRLALEDHARWLGSLEGVARGSFALGEEKLDELLAIRMIEGPARAVLERGEREAAATRSALEEAALTVLAEAGHETPPDPVRAAWEVTKRDHATTFEGVVAAHREACDAARAFVADRGLATVPDVPLEIVETPSYLRHIIPFAAYVEPARFDEAPAGTYLVTPKVDLSLFPHAEIRNTTVHEAWPGHHLQLSVANRNPSLARALVGAPETIEGWALYCEGLLGRHGFTASPKERFVRAKDAHWRALRVVLDVGLHTGRLRFEEAAARLARETGMTAEEATAEVKRYTLEPGYNLSYHLGRKAIEALAARLPEVPERAFHDALVAAGSLPVPLLERAMRETLQRPARAMT
ncbi:MAG TPA: DUF885 domain-containing protein [Candidatus Thermoplasmatota archaeon]|nr:DUF885 domain-containing protein [Candidatus Thermoplasmatota archaeon]